MAVDRLRHIKVILDTNAILMPFQFKLNLDSELTRLLGQYEIIIPNTVIEELENISSSANSPKEISAALALAGRFNIEQVINKGDNAIFELAMRYKAIVLTNDKLLKKRLHDNGLKTISLKSKTHLVLDEF